MINDPKFTLNENNGGINWGYCTKNEVSSSMNNKKKYNIYISTSPIPNSGTSYNLNLLDQLFSSLYKGVHNGSTS